MLLRVTKNNYHLQFLSEYKSVGNSVAFLVGVIFRLTLNEGAALIQVEFVR